MSLLLSSGDAEQEREKAKKMRMEREEEEEGEEEGQRSAVAIAEEEEEEEDSRNEQGDAFGHKKGNQVLQEGEILPPLPPFPHVSKMWVSQRLSFCRRWHTMGNGSNNFFYVLPSSLQPFYLWDCSSLISFFHASNPRAEWEGGWMGAC